MKSEQRGFVDVILLIWLGMVLGWCLNIYQVVSMMPSTFGEMTPFWVFKIVSILVAPVGSVLGYVGLFQ